MDDVLSHPSLNREQTKGGKKITGARSLTMWFLSITIILLLIDRSHPLR